MLGYMNIWKSEKGYREEEEEEEKEEEDNAHQQKHVRNTLVKFFY